MTGGRTLPGFSPPPTLGEAVVGQLRTEILNGTLAPGAPIRDAEIAKRLGVSVTPVRESIAVLISEGLVEALPSKRRCVAVLTQRRAQELMDVLGVVLAAGLERIPSDHPERAALAEACRSFAAHARKGDVQRSGAAFTDLAALLFELAGNGELRLSAEHVLRRSLGPIQLYPSAHLLPLWAEAFEDIASLLVGGPGDPAAAAEPGAGVGPGVPAGPIAAAARCRAFFADLLRVMAAEREESAVVHLGPGK